MVRGSPGKVAAAFALAAVVGIVGMQPLVGAVNTNTGSQVTTNETVTVDSGSYVPLSGYDLDPGTVTVYAKDGTGDYQIAANNSDYSIRYGAGSIRAEEGSTLIEDAETVRVSYEYQASDGFTSTILQYIPVAFAVVILFVVTRGIQEVS